MALTNKMITDLNRSNRANQNAATGTLLASLEASQTAQAVFANSTQALVANGAITVKQGVVTIAKTVAGVVAGTLADPTATTDDYKRLVIINAQAQSNTVTSATSFGGGGGSFDVATFDAAIGGTLELMAYQGKWYIVGSYGVTLS